jgi:hypothetical protein
LLELGIFTNFSDAWEFPEGVLLPYSPARRRFQSGLRVKSEEDVRRTKAKFSSQNARGRRSALGKLGAENAVFTASSSDS